MRLVLVVLAGLFTLILAAPAGAAPQSDNVRLLGKLPDSAGAIGARFSPDGETMYVTSATGLQIYDVAVPAVPRKLSQLALPHFENEDVDVGRDTVVISNDPSFSGVGAIYLIDVADPRAPRIRSVLPTNLPAIGQENSDNGHIANCIAGCDYLYTTGTSEGLTVYDIRDLDAPRKAGVVALPGNGFTHDVEVDDTGIAWVTGEDGTFGYDTTDPLAPELRYRSDPSIVNTGGGLPGDDGSGPLDFLHHNLKRVSGDILAITEEDYLKPGCEGQGSLQTWRITDERNADGTIKLALLDLWTTELNELANLTGRSPATVNCSAHWFDVDGRPDRPGLVRPGRPLPRRLRPGRDRAGRLPRHAGHVLGGVLRARRPERGDRLRARHGVGRRRAPHRPPGRRDGPRRQAGDRRAARRPPHLGAPQRALGLRLPAARLAVGGPAHGR